MRSVKVLAKQIVSQIVGVVGLAFLLTACAGAEGEWTPPDNQTNKDTAKYLDLVGTEFLTLSAGQKTTLAVSYTEGRETPLVNETIAFEIRGYGADSVLSSYFVATGTNGVAQTVLTAGPYTSSFQVDARSPDGQSVTWSVTVGNGSPTNNVNAPKFEGNFNIVSSFDVEDNFEGSKVSSVLNILNDISDDGDDPGRFIVDMIIDATPNETIKDVAFIVKPTLYALVNSQLADKAGDLVNRFKQISANLATISREYTIQSTLRDGDPIATGGQGTNPIDTSATSSTTSQRTHMLESLSWVINGQNVSYTFSQLGMDNPQTQVSTVVNNGSNSWTPGVDQGYPSSSYLPTFANRIFIAEHTFKFNSGAFLLAAFENVILPQVAGTTSVADLLRSYVSCDNIGTKINDIVGLGGVSFWQATCDLGLNAGGALIEQQIAKIGGQNSTLVLKGDASLADTNSDHYYDSISNGRWYGTISLDDNVAELTNGYNAFNGSRTY